MKISAVIFDLDGTILENDREYEEAFNEVLAKLGIQSEAGLLLIGGIGVKKEWVNLIDKYQIKTDKTLDELTILTQAAYVKRLPEIKIKEGFREFTERLKDSGILLGLATSNNWEVVDKIVENFGLENIFDATVTIEEAMFPKPSPDLFLITADKLDIPPSECLVIEDSPAGIEAAHEAGMKVVGIAQDEDKEKSLEKADLLVEGFDAITPEALVSLTRLKFDSFKEE